MQDEAVQVLEQTGILDKLLGPLGGLVLAVLCLGGVLWHHLKTIQRHAEQLADGASEIRRLSDARVEEEKARSESARVLIDRVEAHHDKVDARWAKLGQVLARIEIIIRAVGKKAGATASRPVVREPPPPDENGGVSMF